MLELVKNSQYGVLCRVFWLRVIDFDLMSADADESRLTQQFITILITISLFFALPVLMSGGHRLSLEGGWTAEHFFIETTMTIAALMAALNWDSVFPDKRDVLVLLPLPLRSSTLLLAKVSVLLGAPMLAMISFNLISGMAWPLLFVSDRGGLLGVPRSLFAYWITICFAAAFTVFVVIAVQGLAANLLPRRIFLQVSALLQAGFLCSLLCIYFLEPSLESVAGLTDKRNHLLLASLPSYWFLGLFQQLNGSMHPAMAILARRAWNGVAISSVIAVLSLLLYYFRLLPRIIEQPDIVRGSSSMALPSLFGDAIRNAVTMFSLRTLLRSRQHRMILSVYLGIGVAIVVGYINTPFAGVPRSRDGLPISFLLASIVMVGLTVLALRVVASIPIFLQANWIFRVTQVQPVRHYLEAARFSWLALGVMPVLVILTGASIFSDYPWSQVLVHLFTMLSFGMLVIEICLLRFQKIPFACSYLPGKANIHLVFWAALLFFVRGLKEAASFEHRLLNGTNTVSVRANPRLISADVWQPRRQG